MHSTQELFSPPVDPERARNLVMSLERHGIETGRIHVDTAPPISTEDAGRVDRKSVGRPASRAAIGLAAGIAVGLVLGFVAASVLDTTTSGTVLAVTVAGALIGGLVGLYSKLPMSVEISDADSGHPATIRVDVSGLPEDRIEVVAQTLASD